MPTDIPRPRPEHDEYPVDELHALDPARRLHPDLADIEARIRQRIEVAESADASTTAALPTATAVRTAPSRPAVSRSRWLAVAATIATVALAGGTALIASHGGTPNDTTAPAAGQTATAVTTSAGPSTTIPTSGTRLPGTAPSTTFNAQGLSADPGADLPVWRFDQAAVSDAATAQRVATVMSVPGTPAPQPDGWSVGDTDGSGPGVQILDDGVGTATYNDPAAFPCDDTNGMACAADVTPIDATTAVQRSTDILVNLGLNPGDYTITGPDGDQTETPLLTVQAELTVDGAATGQQWSFLWSGDRLGSFSGPLAPIIPLGTYPTLSPTQATDRLNDPRFAPTPSADDTISSPAAGTMTDSSPASTAAAVQVTIVDAQPMVIPVYVDGKDTLLTPGYTLSDADGQSWTVGALTDADLDLIN